MNLLKPIFMDLSSDKLLQRCVVGATQNANESINSLVWLRCQKHKFNGASIVQYAAATAVLQFNGGSMMTAKLMESLGTPVSTPSKKRLGRRDSHRINKLSMQTATNKRKEDPLPNNSNRQERILLRKLREFHMEQLCSIRSTKDLTRIGFF